MPIMRELLFDGLALEWLGLLQWPALVVTVIAAWLVSTERRWKRLNGFYMFLLSNVLWIIWGVYAGAYALVFLQVFLGVSNIHGVRTHSRQPAG